MDIEEIINRYYAPGSCASHILKSHGLLVAEKSLQIARRIKDQPPDTVFIREAAMLHDIGMFLTNEPGIGCHGKRPYICHGYLGREILEREGIFRHALVCERHVGAGISAREIEEQHLPLPPRDMLPVSMEEQIICVADKFFSKGRKIQGREKTLEEVRAGILRYGADALKRFETMAKRLGIQ